MSVIEKCVWISKGVIVNYNLLDILWGRKNGPSLRCLTN